MKPDSNRINETYEKLRNCGADYTWPESELNTTKTTTAQKYWKEFTSNPAKFASVALNEIAKMCVGANAGEFTLKQNSTIKGKRYRIEMEIKMHEIPDTPPLKITTSSNNKK